MYTTSTTKSYWHFQEEPHLWSCIYQNQQIWNMDSPYLALKFAGPWKKQALHLNDPFQFPEKALNINFIDCTPTSTNRLKQPLEIRKPLWCKKRWQSLHGKCVGENLKNAKSLFHENSTGWHVSSLFVGWGWIYMDNHDISLLTHQQVQLGQCCRVSLEVFQYPITLAGLSSEVGVWFRHIFYHPFSLKKHPGLVSNQGLGNPETTDILIFFPVSQYRDSFWMLLASGASSCWFRKERSR